MTDRIYLVPWPRRPTTLWLPFIGPIYLIPERYEHDDRYERALLHERVHGDQIRRIGALRFYASWLFSRRRRFELEAEAFAADVRWWWNRGRRIYRTDELVIDHYARTLAEHYWLKVSVDEAKRAILGHVSTKKAA